MSKIQVKQKMHQQSSRAGSDSKNTREYEKLQTEENTITIYTDSRMALDSLKNIIICAFLIEEIRRKLTEKGKTNWKIQFVWVKVHVEIQGNELADTFSKEAATNMDIK